MKKTSIFIIPRASTEWKGNEAGWITASGWASAAEQIWGEALVGTTDGVYVPSESMLFPKSSNKKSGAKKSSTFRKLIPEFIITAIKDWKLLKSKPAIWPIEQEVNFIDKKVTMVWERHDLFPGPGKRLAQRFGVPFVISVEALAVWEAKKWGVKRPIWGKWLEKNFEAKSLKGADLVSCVSEELRDKVISMGVSAAKVIVSPNRVDSSIFNPDIDGKEISLKYNLKDKRIIGWTGSFRGFHGLDTVLKAFGKVHYKYSDTVLMLVGDGLEFEKTKVLINDLNLNEVVILPGRKPFNEIPKYVINFHVALVSASTAEGFHYSPLKLREYLATGRPVIAPKAGDLPKQFHEGVDLLFYEAGNELDLFSKLCFILEDDNLRKSLSNQALLLFEKEGTWLHEMKIVCDKLEINY